VAATQPPCLTLAAACTAVLICTAHSVNMPGTSYSINTATGVVAAIECPVNTYSSGLRRQRGCLPCELAWQLRAARAHQSWVGLSGHARH
jgi:hypothetical protein